MSKMMILNGFICFELFKVVIVVAVGSCDLCGSGSGSMKWLDARIIGLIECISDSKIVGSGGNDDTEMDYVGTSAFKMDCSRIGVEFFLELVNGNSGWFARYGD